MTDPKHAIDTGNGRYYKDPAGGPDLVSVTNVLGTAVEKESLRWWAAGLAANWAADHRIEFARRARADRTALVAELKGLHEDVGAAAADLGTRIHAACEARLLGAPIPDDGEVAPFLKQFETWLTRWDVDPDKHVLATEMTFAHRRLGYAGTGDLVVLLPTGHAGKRETWLVDHKTSATRPASSVYPENALQLAALRYCEAVWLPDDTDGVVPPIEHTAVLNLRPRSHALVPVPGDRAAHRAFRGALETTRWLHAAADRAHTALTPPPAGDAVEVA